MGEALSTLAPLTVWQLRAARTDDELFALISGELQRVLPGGEGDDPEAFVAAIRRLPVGLRAMSSIYQLDVSMTLDDLGWHFAQRHHRPTCDETLRGLRELGAAEEADIFAAAYRLVDPHWRTIGDLVLRDFQAFVDWYIDSPLDKALAPLNQRMWDSFVQPDGTTVGLLRYWPRYARLHPSRVAGG